ncbi:MAG: asparaginase [Acidaminococcaceae bacterium]
MMKKILLLTTGGTIACEPGADGLVPVLDGAALMGLVPAVAAYGQVTCRAVFCLDSSNLQPAQWSRLAQILGEEYERYDGFIITHGTDTMAYTAAALAVMLVNWGKPVVLTGAQLPIIAPHTDGKANLVSALQVATSGRGGVFLAFGDRVIDGCCAHKIDTENFNAFVSVNRPAVGQLQQGQLYWQEEAVVPVGHWQVRPLLEPRVLLLKLIPGLSPTLLDFAVAQGYRGVVLEGFGAGGVPTADNNFLPAVERACTAGLCIVCATQCTFGGVDLTKYPLGVLAAQVGVLSAGKRSLEATVTRLMWTLANQETF